MVNNSTNINKTSNLRKQKRSQLMALFDKHIWVFPLIPCIQLPIRLKSVTSDDKSIVFLLI